MLLPCFNEEAAIAQTVAGFRAALPSATIYVYDNNSADRTMEIAAAAGAVVRRERQQGKGHVVRRMFADIDADIYIMADGDLTYDPAAAPAMVALALAEQLDMVVGTRQHAEKDAYRLLQAYAKSRVASVAGTRAAFGTEFIHNLLKKRLFSSPRAFAITVFSFD